MEPAAPGAWESRGFSAASTTVPRTQAPGVSTVHSLAWWAQRSHRKVWELSCSQSGSFFWRRILQIPPNSFHSKSVQLEVPGWVVAAAAAPSREPGLSTPEHSCRWTGTPTLVYTHTHLSMNTFTHVLTHTQLDFQVFLLCEFPATLQPSWNHGL